MVAVPENGQDFDPCSSVDQTQVFIALVVALHAMVLAVRLSVALYRA
ncbi:MAG: photosystem I reaction center subunit XII [Synechococcus sp. SB0678_bin_12]|nr:photosystem I reaction center subunit XII [Synechococcus sp. SB0678_bin_12]